MEAQMAGMGYFSAPFERFIRDEASDWAGAFTLLGALNRACYTILD